MIKSVVVPWIVASPEEGAAISRIFHGLGFSEGVGWSDRRSAGEPYIAPLGAIEVIHGMPPAPADLIVEVQDLRITYERLRELGAEIVRQPYESHWGSQICVVQVCAKRIAFFEFIQDDVEAASASPQRCAQTDE